MKYYITLLFIIIFLSTALIIEKTYSFKVFKPYIKEFQGKYSKAYLLNVIKPNTLLNDKKNINYENCLFFNFLIVRNKEVTGKFTFKETKDYICNGKSYNKLKVEKLDKTFEPYTVLKSSEKWINYMVDLDSKLSFLSNEKSILMTIAIPGLLPRKFDLKLGIDVGWDEKTEKFIYFVNENNVISSFPKLKINEWEKNLNDAIHCYKRVNYNESLALINITLSLAEKKHGSTSKEFITSLTWQGAILSKIKKYKKAEEKLKTALKIIKELNLTNLEEKPIIYSLLSYINKELLNYEECKINEEYAIKEWENLIGKEFNNEPLLYFRVADKFRVMGMFEVSKILYEKTLNIFENHSKSDKLNFNSYNNEKNKKYYSIDTAILFANTGWIYHQKKEKVLAFQFYNSALKLFESSENMDDWHVPVLDMRIAALKNMPD